MCSCVIPLMKSLGNCQEHSIKERFLDGATKGCHSQNSSSTEGCDRTRPALKSTEQIKGRTRSMFRAREQVSMLTSVKKARGLACGLRAMHVRLRNGGNWSTGETDRMAVTWNSSDCVNGVKWGFTGTRVTSQVAAERRSILIC